MPLTTLTFDVPAGKAADFRKKVAAIGYPVVEKKEAPAQEAPKKRKLTSVQKGFVEGYREMVEAEKGGKPLTNWDDGMRELQEFSDKIWGKADGN